MSRVYYQKKPDKAFILLKYDKKNPECGEDYIRSPLTCDAQPGRFLMKLNSIFPTLHSGSEAVAVMLKLTAHILRLSPQHLKG